MAPEPTAVLLLPRTLDGFIQYDQAQDLLRSPAVVAVEPARVPYGAFGRLPVAAARRLAGTQARRLKLPGSPRVIAMFHPFQYPLARALVDRHPGSELWYMLWDRYDHAYDATPNLVARLRLWHDAALRESALRFAVTETLVEIERARGFDVALTPSAADSFPLPGVVDRAGGDAGAAPGGDAGAAPVVAVALGNIGWRYDWELLRAVCAQMPELVVLMIGAIAEDQVADDAGFAACRDLPNLVWLGRRPDAEAARLMLCADVGILPFKVDPFNDAGIPNRILKAARLGRRTVTPMLSGVLTYAPAVLRADGTQAWIDALRAEGGVRVTGHAELREWALEQTAERIDNVLWRRLAELGIAVPDGAGAGEDWTADAPG